MSNGVKQTASKIILASASPRRRELLVLLGVRFTVVVSRFNENSLSHIADPVEYVRQAAESKALEVAQRRDGIILGVDTDVVAPDNTILGKPKDAADAFRLLKILSGVTHRVYTAVALVESKEKSVVRKSVCVIESRVTFGMPPDDALRAYIATGEPMDKAGAYGLQGRAMAFVSYIEGDLSAIIGLPLTTTAQMLTDFGVPLYRFDETAGHGG